MKTSERVPKAIVVIVVVGISLLYNMRDKSLFTTSFRGISSEFEEMQINADSAKRGENKLFIYTKSIINTSIQHLISNL